MQSASQEPVVPAVRAIVLDTNIVLDLFVFNDAATPVLLRALQAGHVRWIASPPMREELERVLAYTHIGAGASWVGEYGDPAIPAERAVLETYSPYQKLAAGKAYPKVFIETSTKDDRVHPAHARKAAARLKELGYDFLYYENVEGGHAAAANLNERALRQALEYTYLHQRLVD